MPHTHVPGAAFMPPQAPAPTSMAYIEGIAILAEILAARGSASPTADAINIALDLDRRDIVLFRRQDQA